MRASVKVNGRVLHACKALGMSEGKAMPAAMLAKRLRGLGLAWHSFTLEECQVCIKNEEMLKIKYTKCKTV